MVIWTVEQLQKIADSLLLDARAVERYVRLPKFVEAYEKMTLKERGLCCDAIATLEVRPLKILVLKYKYDVLDQATWATLRSMCSQLMIPNYSAMDRGQMIAAIKASQGDEGLNETSDDRLGDTRSTVDRDGTDTARVRGVAKPTDDADGPTTA